MKRLSIVLIAACVAWLAPTSALASDPPHVVCSACHMTHEAPGATLTAVAGNANLCISCHMPGGSASARPFSPNDQAYPAPGLAGRNASGTSHRWDSGPAGHVVFGGGAAVASTGRVSSRGAYVGPYAKTYTITITASGNTGTALFSWTATTPGGGSGTGLATLSAVPPGSLGVFLDQGVYADFLNGTGTSFQTGDKWYVYVRPDLQAPANAEMALRLENGVIMCSTCHDVHSQAAQPFGPGVPAYAGAGTGAGRHFQRTANETSQMCVDCHAPRNVITAAQGSHPVGVVVPAGGAYKSPTLLPLDEAEAKVRCQTCHTLHYAPASNGLLVRVSNVTTLCSDCHTLADTATPASHMSATSGVLWPGGRTTSGWTTFPQETDTSQRGACTSCHQPHGWPNAANTAQDYASLLVEGEEKLCYTCHDADGPASRKVEAEFAKASRHAVASTSGVHVPGEPATVASRHVECDDCHNSHWTKARVSLPGSSTSPRVASGPLARVRGIDKTGAEVTQAAYEYEVCFRCHADSQNLPAASTPRQFPQTNLRLEFAGTYASYHAVAAAGKNTSVPSLITPWTSSSYMACTSCHNNNTGPTAGGTGPNGPHGSTNPRLLERRYVTADNTSYSAANYALCFKCHSATSIMNDASFKDHNKHINGERTPCNVCHDPHASSGTPKLINFDTRVVTPYNGRIEFRSTGPNQGLCTLTCHGQQHNAWSY